ncbi:hypothetical protein BGZ95_012023 [Linnemannia exigua]|uniref:RRM domain-containing protein n=1 Tax=Linnemannia exigua TaxID=604196 RepID=A0AAD4DAS9_9FUNG|nr:hypothetical protein BGZ95_012023 [Linnemannia exigua]
MATALRKALSQATITATRVTAAPAMATTQPRSVLCRYKALSSSLSFRTQDTNNSSSRQYSTATKHQNRRNRIDHDHSDDIFDRNFSPSAPRPAKPEYNGDPDLYRIFFRSPDKMRSLEEAQVFINHIKSSYGPLTQYQFARCPETRKYFGYGFVTFRNKDSLDKALNDAYIRVGMKDFELIRSDNNNRNRKPIKHKNTGFTGFNDLEELRAKKLKQQDELEEQLKSLAEIEAVEAQLAGAVGDVSSAAGSEAFASDSSSLSTTTTTTTTASADDSNSTSTDPLPPASKPYFVPLQKRGMAQLWKIIPNEIERAGQTTKEADESDEGETVVHKVDSKKLAAELVGDILDTKP